MHARGLVPLVLLVPFTGCAAFQAPFEPVFTEALWGEPDLAVVAAPVPDPPRELTRAARTGEGVWHVETRYASGRVLHQTYDPGDRRLRAGEPAMSAWASAAAYDRPSAWLETTPGPWPADALPFAVLQGAPLADAGDETALRLADRELQLRDGEGEWRTLAGYPLVVVDPPPVTGPPRESTSVRVARDAVRVVLTPPALALDAGYLGIVSVGRVGAAVLIAPLLIALVVSGGRLGC